MKARNYMGKAKWLFGKIKSRVGKLHYLIKIDDGKEWRRHADQIEK